MTSREFPTMAAEVAVASPFAEKSEDPAADAVAQEDECHPDTADLKSGTAQLTPPTSAIKGRSGRERSADRKLRFDPNVQVVQTPSFVLVMTTEERDDEAEELAIFDRLYDEARRRAERTKKLEQPTGEEAMKDELECTFKPVLSGTAKALDNYPSWGYFLKAQEDRKKTFEMHFKKKKEKIFSDERAPLFDDIPRKHSLKIIAYLEKERKYSGPIKGWRERFRKYMTRLHEQELDSSINNSSRRGDVPSVHSGIVRDDTVFDRLYEEANVRMAAQRVMLLTQLEKEARELYRPATNGADHWGSGRGATLEYGDFMSTSCTTTRSCGSTVFDDLYAKSEEYQRRREARATAAAESQEEFSFRPTTNPHSSRIIVERAIARAKGELPQRRRTEERATSQSPRPREPPRRFQADIFCSRLQRNELERAERIASLRRETRMEEVAECTFRPSLSRRSVAITEQKGYGRVAFARAPVGAVRAGSFRAPRATAREEESFETEEDKEWEREEEGAGGARRGGDIEALASELRGVLSTWTEALEEAQGAF